MQFTRRKTENLQPEGENQEPKSESLENSFQTIKGSNNKRNVTEIKSPNPKSNKKLNITRENGQEDNQPTNNHSEIADLELVDANPDQNTNSFQNQQQQPQQKPKSSNNIPSNGNNKQINPLEEKFETFQFTREKTRLVWVVNCDKVQKTLRANKTIYPKDEEGNPKIVTNQMDQDWQVEILKTINSKDKKEETKFRISADYNKEITRQLEEIRLQQEEFQSENKMQIEPEEQQNQEQEPQLSTIFRTATILCKIYYQDKDNNILEKKKELNKYFFNSEKQDYHYEIDIPYLNQNGQLIIVVNLGCISSPVKNKNSRDKFGYIGLQNEGNTCYMNSFLQIMFHLRPFRNLIYRMQTKLKENLPAPLQKLFYDLQYSQKSIGTIDLIHSFGWDKKQANVQHDVAEFQCLLFDALEDVSRPTPDLLKEFKSMFTGKQKSYIKCVNVNFESSRVEEFNDIKLNIKDSKDIMESFEHYINEEHLDGENQYHAEQHGKQDAVKGVKFLELPDILLLHLKRFEYDFQKDENTKIMDRWEYYSEIDLKKFVAGKEQNKSQEFVLLGVLIHTGNYSGTGHYYVYLRPNGPNTKWLKFNDQLVEQVSDFQVYEQNFGGPRVARTFEKDKYQFKQEEDTYNSTAYMLTYIRKSKLQQFMNNSFSIPPWITQKIEDDQKQREEQERQENYITICITCFKNLKLIGNITGYFFLKYTKNQELEENHMEKYSISLEVEKRLMMDQLFEQLADQLDVDVNLLTFWLVTLKNKNEIVRNVNYIRTDKAYNKKVGEMFSQTAKDQENILLILPLQNDSMRIEMDIERNELKKITGMYSMNNKFKDIYQDILDRKRYLVFIKICNEASKKYNKTIKLHSYHFPKVDQTFNEFMSEFIESENNKLTNYSLKFYNEVSYQLTEIEEEQQNDKLQDIFSKVRYSGIILINLTEEDQSGPGYSKIFFDYLNQNYLVQFIDANNPNENSKKIKIRYDSDYYEVLQRLQDENFLTPQQANKIDHVYLKAKIKTANNKGNPQLREIPFPTYEKNQQNSQSPKYTLEQMVKHETKIYVCFDEMVKAKDRQNQRSFEISYYQQQKQQESEVKKFAASKTYTIGQIIEEIQTQGLFDEYIYEDQESLQILENPSITKEEQNQQNLKLFTKQKTTDRIQFLLSPSEKQIKYKPQTNQFLLMNFPTKYEDGWIIIGHNFAKGKEQEFDKSFVFQVNEKATYKDVEEAALSYLSDRVLQYIDGSKVMIKDSKFSNGSNKNVVSEQNLEQNIEKRTTVQLALYSNFVLTEDMEVISSSNNYYDKKLAPFYEVHVKSDKKVLYLQVEHTNLYTRDNILKLKNDKN